MNAAGEPYLRVGVAERDITPTVGMESIGGYTKVHLAGIHDACKARAFVVDDGQAVVAFVGVDVGAIDRTTVSQARREIESWTGIPAGSVMIAASHTHFGGPLGWARPKALADESDLVRRLAYELSPTVDEDYERLVIAGIVAAVCQAFRLRVRARCGFGAGHEDSVAFNRRLRMRNGQTWTHPRKGNPDMLGFAGPTDPQVGVMGAWDMGGGLLGCVVNYACHATTGPAGGLVSASYIRYIEGVIRAMFGADAVVVFLPGASGDVTQVNNCATGADPVGDDWSKLVGGQVGIEAAKALLSAVAWDELRIEGATEVLRLKRRAPSRAHVERAVSLVGPDPTDFTTEWVFAKETVLADALARVDPEVAVEVQALGIGPSVFVASPAELFCEVGLEIKRLSEFPLTFPVTLANGFVGYVPTEEAFGPRGGGYETRLTSLSNLETSASRQIKEASLALVRAMSAPPPLPAMDLPARRAPWDYGNNPPGVD